MMWSVATHRLVIVNWLAAKYENLGSDFYDIFITSLYDFHETYIAWFDEAMANGIIEKGQERR